MATSLSISKPDTESKPKGGHGSARASPPTSSTHASALARITSPSEGKSYLINLSTSVAASDAFNHAGAAPPPLSAASRAPANVDRHSVQLWFGACEGVEKDVVGGPVPEGIGGSRLRACARCQGCGG